MIGHLVGVGAVKGVGAGEQLGGRYRLVERLGTGGMSEVWRGHDEVLDRPVAVKMLAGRQATDRALRRRVRIEAKAAARLSHPHVTSVYDYGESPGPDGEPIPFVVMEVVDGVPMAKHLAGGRALPWPVAVRACAQVATALTMAHAHGVVHRDVKPGNVMLTLSGVKVLDFGISALVGDPDGDEDGSVLGTPAYLAPERLGGSAVTPASDVYALGVLVYRSLTGRLPWSADTTTQMLKAHLYVEPDPMPAVDGLPPEVAALCERCLAKDPGDRPTSEQAARELTAVLGTVPDPAPVPLVVDLDTRPQRNITIDSPTRRRIATSALPTAVRLLSTGHRPSRRALVATGVMVSIGMACAATAWPAGPHSARGATATVAEGIGPRPDSCAVEYRVSRDTGSGVTADLAVTNTGPEPFHGWQLSFDLPGDQQLGRGTNASWRQDDRTVTARADGVVLPPAATVRLTFAASYRTSNPLPVTYHLNGITCSTVVMGAPANSPSTAAPQPTRDAAPGLSTGGKQTEGDDQKGEKKHDKGKDKG
jgi:eukaryotic-like serine/threonine-protein kinase